MKEWLMKQRLLVLSVIFYTFLVIMVLCAVSLEVLNKDQTYRINIGSVMFAAFAVIIPLYIQANIDDRNNKDKTAVRKVELIQSVKSTEIKDRLENLYKNVLQGKSIDKIEIVNTSIGQNDNRKDVIIIYH